MSGKRNLDYLLPETAKVLSIFIDEASFLSKYVLVGGSALASYLHHRKSEDLDFFTYTGGYNTGEVIHFLGRFSEKEILNETKEQIDVLCDGVKVTFFNAGWDFLKPESIEPFNLAPLEALAAMKVHVLFLRARFRDYYDIYCLAREKLPIEVIFEQAKQVVEGLTYKLFCIALTYIDDIEDDSIDHLDPKYKVTKQDIRNFFEKKLRL